jgi:hypothetical protein
VLHSPPKAKAKAYQSKSLPKQKLTKAKTYQSKDKSL